ncbi:DUF1296 domain-containing protein [Cephalotus follicularis]|uniref:DUF1296 domain-containing protein n=1 Tax=Cephalotus follicularis TaxID=3775 RepID=A0A1Q3AVA1_CEPFO|nr:DUF1296 domain-containing protein [Cephalotus follicularis]
MADKSSSSTTTANTSDPIPNSAKKTIQTIRELTGKQHSDDDIYSVLRECSMDPNETAQKLLYLDTFHEVKRKRDRRKESSMPGTHGPGARGGRGNYSANYFFSDSGNGRNGASRRENGANHLAERGSLPLPLLQQMKSNAVPRATKIPAAITSGPSSLSNGSYSKGPHPQVSVVNESENCLADENKLGMAPRLPAIAEKLPSLPALSFSSVVRNEREKSTLSSNHYPTLDAPDCVSVDSSPSDPVLEPPLSQEGATKDVGSQWTAVEPNNIQGNKHVSHDVDSEFFKIEKAASGALFSVVEKEVLRKSKTVERNQASELLQSSCSSAHVSSPTVRSPEESVVSLEVAASEAETVSVKANSQVLPESNVPDGQHVTFPNHFRVPEALKNGLTFGSFDANLGLEINHVDNTGGVVDTDAVESSHGTNENAGEPSPSSQSLSSTVLGDNTDYPQSAPLVYENVPSSGDISSGTDLKSDHSKQEIQLLPGHQNTTIQNVPNYNLGFMSAFPGNHLVQFEGPETQSGNRPASSSSSQTSVVHSSTATSPQVALFRQPYPPNYFTYGHYLPPFYIPPIHQFLSPNGLPQQPSAGNVYLPPPAAAPGVKFPLPPFKPGTNAGNPAHIGIPSGYGSYNSSPVGSNHVPAMTSGSSTSSEDLLASRLKDSHIYTTAPMSEGSAVWIHAPHQDLSSLQLSSLYNLPLQGQHLAYSPAQAAFAGIYQPAQSVAAPSNANPHLQQSQPMGTVETVIPPSGTYQHPQLAQINWNANY